MLFLWKISLWIGFASGSLKVRDFDRDEFNPWLNWLVVHSLNDLPYLIYLEEVTCGRGNSEAALDFCHLGLSLLDLLLLWEHLRLLRKYWTENKESNSAPTEDLMQASDRHGLEGATHQGFMPGTRSVPSLLLGIHSC